ncbi:MAG: hypothetical protein IJU91_01060 [Selenomonadaceae bacterium]|nr:hypothetical protein [Selenomonadaceae bacterium]
MSVMSDIKIVGIGWEGNDYLEKFSERTSWDVTAISISSSRFDLEKSSSKIKIDIASDYKYMIDGWSPPHSEKLAIKHYDEIFQALSDAELVIMVSDIGDADGGGATPLVSYLAKDIGAVSVAVVCFPFYFAGQRRRKSALDTLIKLNSAADYVCLIESDYILSYCPPKTPMTKAWEIISNLVAETVSQILNCYEQLKSDELFLQDIKRRK